MLNSVMRRLKGRIIKILNSVVQRLKGEITGENKEVKAEPAAPPSAPSPPPAPEPAKETPPTPPSSIPTPAPAPVEPSTEQIPHHVWQRPIIQYIEEPSLSALKVKQEKEVELKNLEDYWNQRLVKQQEEHIAMAKLTDDEFNKSLKKVETLFATSGVQGVCRDESDAVRDCYSSNSGKSLRCRDSVNSFAKCVSSARLAG
ncbi:MICOS complex subunit mic25a isoform X1 [Eurytemora carolleeae]|uniref:MICOS complex subunit mic25a isoform X1 n=1 Tax=Eurytemora carolleeae TaxID=1294199 RepID=UPI000C78BEDB|nr:MICOS complex subunit mic25a isoform X1 [Eurytemora carolleeae]|eukprot:XP_023322094.1 MICOS complex subunit mic25a-like isoform X1 [Eurytemora affinis]